MNRFAVAVIALLSAVGGLVACPSYSAVRSAPYVAPAVVAVTPVYPSVATTEVIVKVNIAEYSAFLAPAVVVPYVPPPLPPPVVVPQTSVVPLAVPGPVCPPATMPAASLSVDQCSQILAELHSMKADIAALKAGAIQGALPPPVVPAQLPSKRPAAAIVTNCAACHTAGKLMGKAPAFFGPDGLSTMTVGQIVKARHKIKDSKMPPPDSPQAKAATPESLNETLEGLDVLEEATVEPTPAPVPAPAPVPNP